MNIFRIAAFEVPPQRTTKKRKLPRGGEIAVTTDISLVFDKFLKKSALHNQSTVDFVASKKKASGKRIHSTRDLLLEFLFSTQQNSMIAAKSLAKLLSKAMDERSPKTLLLLVGYKSASARKVVLWAFPKDEPFYFSARNNTIRISVLKNAFSRNSGIKKAAMFEGSSKQNDFWRGRVIDRQAQSGTGSVADYWVTGFLKSRFTMTAEVGSRLLANTFRNTYDALHERADKDQLSDAVVAVHLIKKARISLLSVANTHLTGEPQRVFLQKCPQDKIKASFSFSADIFDERLGFRVFRMTDEVVISAPFGTIGTSVDLKDIGNQRKLNYTGTVFKEKVKAKRA